MNKMIAITMRPGATTAATRPTEPELAAFTTTAPESTITRKKVPNTSAKILRDSNRGFSKFFLCLSSSALTKCDRDWSVSFEEAGPFESLPREFVKLDRSGEKRGLRSRLFFQSG